MLIPAPTTGKLFIETKVPVTVMGAGTLMVMVALAVRLAPADAVRWRSRRVDAMNGLAEKLKS